MTTANINVARKGGKGTKKGWFKVLTGVDRKGRGAHSLVGEQWLSDGDNDVEVGSVVIEGYYQGRGRERALFLNVTRVGANGAHVALEDDLDFSFNNRPQIWEKLESYLANGQTAAAKPAPVPTVTKPTPKPAPVKPTLPVYTPAPVKASVQGSNMGVGVDRFTDGGFVVWNSRLHSPAMDPQDARDMALAAGLPEEIVPDYAGDRAILSRVIDGNASKLKRKGWVLTSLKRKSTQLLMTIHEANKDVEAKATKLPQVGTLEWSAEPKDASQAASHYNGIISGHEVGTYLDEAYQNLKGKITGSDWTSTLVNYLTSECYAQSWREDGRVYWVPSIGLPKVKELQGWLKSVGVSLAIAEIDSEVRDSVQEVVEANLVDQLDDLASEVDNFNGKQKPSTYADRLERYHTLRKRCIVHTETLGIAKETAEEILSKLDSMEETVDNMLEERKNIRVKRDGTIEYL
jgi:phosphoglycolate phosphatase-like HAD superfamily hydrolase